MAPTLLRLGSFAIPKDFYNGTNLGRLLEGTPSAPERTYLLLKGLGMASFPVDGGGVHASGMGSVGCISRKIAKDELK